MIITPGFQLNTNKILLHNAYGTKLAKERAEIPTLQFLESINRFKQSELGWTHDIVKLVADLYKFYFWNFALISQFSNI